MKKVKHLLSISDLTAKEIWEIFFLAKKLKKELKTKGSNKPFLKNKQMAMVFEKPSLRTKLSFDIGVNQLGGHAVYFGPGEVGLGKRESGADVAKVISGMADIIVARVFNHKDLEELAKNSKACVVNALSNFEHPCQILADLFTVFEIKGKLSGLTLAYVGDGENNVTHSLALGCALLGVNFKCASPKGFWMDKTISDKAKKMASKTKAEIFETTDPKTTVKNADIVYTDIWVSMGDEKEKEKRLKIFKPYQVNPILMSLAKKDAIFMHCLPAYRGNEVTADIIDGPQSVVFQEAENRLHVQKALLIFLLGGKYGTSK